MHHLPGVHGEHQGGFKAVGEKIAGIFPRDAERTEVAVGLVSLSLGFLKDLTGFLMSLHGRGADHRRNLHGDISLALLAVAREAMPHKLMRTDPADMIYPEGKGDMLEGGEVAATGELFQKDFHLGILQIFSKTLRCGSPAVTEAGGLSNATIGKRGVGN
jgi:hypothetical protein